MTDSVKPAALAIVVPAWKPDYFAKALDSIAAQTSRDFHVYIGDDAGSPLLEGIAESRLAGIPHTYHRFESNLGRTDLVAHWHRCIDLTRGEEWIWLFSDDDLMDPGCVDAFLESTSRTDSDLYHFGLATIDGDDRILSTQARSFATIDDYAAGRLRDEVSSSAVEWIFRRTALEAAGGFQKFDMAWASDDATWIKLGTRKPPVLVEGPMVRWRLSSVNISPDQSRATTLRKTRARLDYLQWLRAVHYAGKGPIPAELYFEWFKMTLRTEIVPMGLVRAIGALLDFNSRVAPFPLRSLALLPNLASTRWWRVARNRFTGRGRR